MKYFIGAVLVTLILAIGWSIHVNFKKQGGYCFPESRYLSETEYLNAIEQAWDIEISVRKDFDTKFTRPALSALTEEVLYSFDRGAFNRLSFSDVGQNFEMTVRIDWGDELKSRSRAFVTPCGRVLGFDPF